MLTNSRKNSVMNREIKMNKPVLFITFNRLDTTKQVFEQIKIAQPPRIYLASDGARTEKVGEKENVEEVRKWVLDNINWNCEVKTLFREENLGCGGNISGAITWFFENEEDGIILEDDCVPNLSFFTFCEKMLDKYKDDKRVFAVCGYIPVDCVESDYEYEFASLSHCWGWATWSNRWKFFRRDISDIKKQDVENMYLGEKQIQYWTYILDEYVSGNIDTWYYPWFFCVLRENGLTIFPTKNLISNVGVSGVHYNNTSTDPRLFSKTYDLTITKYRNDYDTSLMDKIFWEYFYIPQNPFEQAQKLKFIQKLFSIKNHPNRKYKVITILGMKIKIKRKKCKK